MDGRFCCENMPFNPKSLKNLRRIVKSTNARIIISSSWRRSEKCMAVLKARLIEYGMKVYSVTPFLDGSRGIEIYTWCLKNKVNNRDKILIIDDEEYDIKQYFNKDCILDTHPYKGLTFIQSLKGIRKIKNNDITFKNNIKENVG